jgi:hypothetical protein
MVTSCNRTAASLQLAEVVPEGVDAVGVTDAIGVGLAKGVSVGGSVAVKKIGVVLAGGGVEIVTQAVRLSVTMSRIGILARIV